MGLKHNVSITMDQELFRQLENMRGREKRSTFIEHLIQTGLKSYKNPQNSKAPPLFQPNQLDSQTQAK